MLELYYSLTHINLNIMANAKQEFKSYTIREYFNLVKGVGVMKNVMSSSNGYLYIGIQTEGDPVYIFMARKLDILKKSQGVVAGMEIKKGFFDNLRVGITYSEEGEEIPKLYEEQGTVSLDSVL